MPGTTLKRSEHSQGKPQTSADQDESLVLELGPAGVASEEPGQLAQGTPAPEVDGRAASVQAEVEEAVAEFDSDAGTDVLDEDEFAAMLVSADGEASAAVVSPPTVEPSPVAELSPLLEPSALVEVSQVLEPSPGEEPPPAAPTRAAETTGEIILAVRGNRRRLALVAGIAAAAVVVVIAGLVISGGEDSAATSKVVDSGEAGLAPSQPEEPAEVVAAPAAGEAGSGEDAASGETVAAAPEPTGDVLIENDPEGAMVYVEGEAIGRTPQTLEATAEVRRMALVLPGYSLYTGEIEGAEPVNASLEPVADFKGRAGIKVRCKREGRYYVSVDGTPVGQLCPTDRIGVKPGPHEVAIFDLETGERRTFDVNIKSTSRSLRVKVD